ncbi:heparin lyase I family protein [Rhizobium herbae]|uniref:Uncharacterized protein n=1 Tax=Rhizobium herbae TaxID=508661 RepID=A0ABS4EW22_9HYPH|nr:heparin lyase I family protein [Rhizobium herbae]MBP1862127.1 hypothetical protein [Rhizobium herbae]
MEPPRIYLTQALLGDLENPAAAAELAATLTPPLLATGPIAARFAAVETAANGADPRRLVSDLYQSMLASAANAAIAAAHVSPGFYDFKRRIYKENGLAAGRAEAAIVSVARPSQGYGPLGALPQVTYPANTPRWGKNGLEVYRAHANLMANSEFAGGKVGVIGAGGILPDGFNLSDNGFACEILAITEEGNAQRMRVRLSRTGANPNKSVTLRPVPYVGETLAAASGRAAHALVRVLASDNIADFRLTIAEINSGVHRESDKIPLTGEWKHIVAFLRGEVGNRINWGFIANPAEAHSFSIEFEITTLMYQQANAIDDITPWAPGPRRTLANNLVTNITAAGAVAGVIGSGGSVPTSWERSNTMPLEIISVTTVGGVKRVRAKFSRTGGAPVLATCALRPIGYANRLVLSNDLYGAVANARIIASTGINNTRLLWTELTSADVLVTNHVVDIPRDGEFHKVAAVATPVNANGKGYVQFVFEPLTTTNDFSVEFEFDAEVEFGIVTYPIINVAADDATLSLPSGTFDIHLPGERGGHILLNQTGVIPLTPPAGQSSLIAKLATLMEVGRANVDRADFAEALDRPVFSEALITTQVPAEWGGVHCRPDADYAITRATNKRNRLRFECRPGDRPVWNAPDTERSEVFQNGLVPFVERRYFSFSTMIEPATVIDAKSWFLFAQLHNSQDATDGVTSPAFAFELQAGSQLAIVVRSSAQNPLVVNPGSKALFRDPYFKLGRFYNWVIELRYDNNAQTSIFRVWRDGKLLFDYDGPLGYIDAMPPYMKAGIYRNNSNRIDVVHLVNYEYGNDSLLERINAPLPIS